MDYEVFLVSRMREAWDSGRSNVEAVALGLERTGGLITAAALVMAASFGAFVIGSVPGLRQLGAGLLFAVLIDATLVRALLVPAIMAIMGRWNWWLPARLTRLAPLRMEALVDS
jgi:RND superfamily putative drug exporter